MKAVGAWDRPLFIKRVLRQKALAAPSGDVKPGTCECLLGELQKVGDRKDVVKGPGEEQKFTSQAQRLGFEKFLNGSSQNKGKCLQSTERKQASSQNFTSS